MEFPSQSGPSGITRREPVRCASVRPRCMPQSSPLTDTCCPAGNAASAGTPSGRGTS
ncbi:hypothetical protein BKA93DRAFT_777865 [Sparassis latifolia]